MTTRVLLTRPRADSEALAMLLFERGVKATIEPLLTVADVPSPPLDLNGVQALVVTSANGARALERAVEKARHIPVYAVGQASAQAARGGGFAHVSDAGVDVAALAQLIRESVDPRRGALVHACGTVVAGDLSGALRAQGYEVRRAIIYRAEESRALSAAVRRDLAAGAFAAVLLYSPRTAQTFVRLVQQAGLDLAVCSLAALCLSPAVAEALRDLALQCVHVAASPTQDGILELLEACLVSHDKPVH